MISLDDLVTAARANLRQRPVVERPDDPVGFMQDVLGWEPWSLQREIALSVVERRRTRVAKCHASGGTALMARLALWWLKAYRPALVLTTAPTVRQVDELLWRELRTAYTMSRVPLGGRLFDGRSRLEYAPDQYAYGFASDKPSNVPGFHSQNVLLLKDEAMGIPDIVNSALESVAAGGHARIVEMSQPLFASGPFYEAFCRGEPGCYQISYDATPNFTGEHYYEGLINQDYVDDQKSQWGEDSDFYRVRVLGQFPRAGADQLFSPDWLKACTERSLRDVEDGPPVLGVDVASSQLNRDLSVITPRRGGRIFTPIAVPNGDQTVVAGWVIQLADRWGAQAIAVDATGVGKGLADNLKALKYPVIHVIAQHRPWNQTAYYNRTAELYNTLARKFRDGLVAGQLTTDLRQELLQIRSSPNSRGQMVVDKFGSTTHSPDYADSLMLTEAAIEAVQRRTLPVHGERA